MKKNGNKPKHMGVSEGQRLLGALNGDKAEMPKPPSYEALVCTCLQSAQMSAARTATSWPSRCAWHFALWALSGWCR